METEKDKHLPEKSRSFACKDSPNDNHNRHSSDPNPNLNPEPHHYQNNDTENLAPSTEAEPKSDPTESDIKEEEEEEEEEKANIATNIEDSPPPPPDFGEVCKEIDQFISSQQPDDPPEFPKVLEHFASLAESKIANYDSNETHLKWSQLVSQEDSSNFLEMVDRISKLTTSLRSFSSDSNYASSINRITGILQRAMSYLEDEFKSFLEDPKVNPDDLEYHNNNIISKDSSKNQETNDQSTQEEEECSKCPTAGDNNFPGYSDEVIMSNLNVLANAMIKGGYETECYQVYTVARRTILEETLHKLGFEKFSIDDVQKMQWEALEKEIDSWNKTFKQCVAVHFTCERKLSEAVFSNHKSIIDGLFNSLSRGIMIQLLNFAEAVAMAKCSSEKLFKFLDIYETLRDVIPAMDDLFPEEMANELKSEASLIRSRLGEAMVCIFCELDNAIKTDMGKTPVPGGAVHPLTRYTMNYLKYACDSYKDTLEQVFREHQKIFEEQAHDSSAAGSSQVVVVVSNSSFALQISKVMDLLDTNLEAKSKLYKDTSLSSIFMMNNGRYILQKIKGSVEINMLMGDNWTRKRSLDLRQYHKNYQRETWGRLLNCLNHEGLNNVHGKVAKPVLKERFKSFNAMFDEIHKTQSTWVVSDEQLQSELRVSISAVVIPAYRSFLARFSQNFTPGRQTEKYIKYQSDDIETYIDELFDGAAAATAGKRRT